MTDEPEKKDQDVPPAPPEKKEETVEVSKSQLEKVLETIESQGQTIQMLEQVADVNRIANYKARNKKTLPTIVHIRKFEGRYIVGWRTIKNEVYQDPLTKVWRENQEVEIIYEDNEKLRMPLQQFELNHERVAAEVKETTTDEDGNQTLVVSLTGDKENVGKKLKIDVTYIN